MHKNNRPRLGRVTRDKVLLERATSLAKKELASSSPDSLAVSVARFKLGLPAKKREPILYAERLALEGYSEAKARKLIYNHHRKQVRPGAARAIIPNALRNQFRPVRNALRDLRKNAAAKSSRAQSQSAKRRARSR